MSQMSHAVRAGLSPAPPPPFLSFCELNLSWSWKMSFVGVDQLAMLLNNGVDLSGELTLALAS